MSVNRRASRSVSEHPSITSRRRRQTIQSKHRHSPVPLVTTATCRSSAADAESICVGTMSGRAVCDVDIRGGEGGGRVAAARGHLCFSSIDPPV